MSTSFLMTLQPLEPYFFGNEKTFSFDPQTPAESRYFIKGDRMPAQTTLLGMLRYEMMPVKRASFRYEEQEMTRNERMIGKESFQIGKDAQTFGVIERLSPVFLMHGGRKYIRTPYDHVVNDANHKANETYTPFRSYVEVETDRGPAWITGDYCAKDGIADSFMALESGKIIPCDQIFQSNTRVGVNKNQTEKGFFKKQFSMLQEGWVFAAYVELDTELVQSDPAAAAALDTLKAGTVAYMGQGKSAFLVRLVPRENTLKREIAAHLHPNAVYCMSDTLTTASAAEECLFAAVSFREHRGFSTAFRSENGKLHGRITKRELLYKLIGSGSVFIAQAPRTLRDRFNDPHAQMIGMNFCVINEEE